MNLAPCQFEKNYTTYKKIHPTLHPRIVCREQQDGVLGAEAALRVLLPSFRQVQLRTFCGEKG